MGGWRWACSGIIKFYLCSSIRYCGWSLFSSVPLIIFMISFDYIYIYIYTLQTSCIPWCIASLFVIHKIYPFKSLAYVVLHINWRMRLYFSLICPLECVLANKSGQNGCVYSSTEFECSNVLLKYNYVIVIVSFKPHNHFRSYTLPPVVLCLTSIWMSLGFRQLRIMWE